MEDFFSKIHTGNIEDPPQSLRKVFGRHFRGALNPEWYRAEDGYEVIFFEDDREKIAFFNLNDELVHLEQNHPPEDLPGFLLKEIPITGKIMNYVTREKGGDIFHEVIIRDKEWKRHLLEFDQTGMLLKIKSL